MEFPWDLRMSPISCTYFSVIGIVGICSQPLEEEGVEQRGGGGHPGVQQGFSEVRAPGSLIVFGNSPELKRIPHSRNVTQIS